MISETMGELYDYSCRYFCHETAIVYSGQKFTFNQLKENSLRLANSLLQLGMRKGDKVGVLMSNCPEFIFIDYAFSKIGLVRVRMATFLEAEDLILMLKETEARALIYHEEFRTRVEKIKPELSQLQHYICAATDKVFVPKGDHHLQTLIVEGANEEITITVQGDDIYTIFYTGGTAGFPKGVIRSHTCFVALVNRLLLDCGIERDEVFLAATPLSHASGSLIVPVYLKGGSCVILADFNPSRFLETIERNKVTLTFVVPTMIYVLIDHPELKKHNIKTLKNIIYSAAPISPDRLKKALKIFGPIFTQVYGATEAPIPLTALHRHEHVAEGDEKVEARLASCGRPSFTTKLKLVDERGNEVPAGELGEIAVRNPSIMLGYLKRPELTAETIKDGWVHTGDIAWQDEEGYIYIVDRKKDMIVSGGFNIFPREIEDVLLKHPAVAMAVVIGVPHPKWGEAVKAVVVAKPGCSPTEEELLAFCKERKGPIIAPKSVDFVDNIPTTPLGKTDRNTLREQYWKDQKRRVS